MKYRISSDWHKNPGQRLTDAEKAFLNCSSDVMPIINGDLLNILPWGKKAWATCDGRVTIGNIAGNAPSQGLILTTGNHEGRYSWLKELFKGYPQVIVTDYIDIGRWHIEHGHRFTDWRIWSQYADDLVLFLTSWNGTLRKLWYNFCKDRGWMPGQVDTDPVHNSLDSLNPLQPTTKYDKLVLAYWDIAQAWALKYKKNLIIGHSHSANIREEMGYKVIDLGTMTKGDYWEGEL